MTPPTGPTTLMVIAKEPVPGKVKTRLVPPYTPRQAADLARAALSDTLDTVMRAPAWRRVLVLEGEAGDWVPSGMDVIPQRGEWLDDRLADAFDQMTGPAVVVGMDTPQMTLGALSPVLGAHAWNRHDAWFGPAEDGGFWALGLAEPRGDLLRGVMMSRADTGQVQHRRLVDAGLRVGELPKLRDFDTVEDVIAVAESAPHSAFAATAKELTV